MAYLYVFIGGGLGSICRYGISEALKVYELTFPLATLIANIISCLILGALVGYVSKNEMDTIWKLIFMTGFCGGFSTFSTFSNETMQLFLSGQTNLALVNVLLSLIICFFCIWVGMGLYVTYG